MPTLEEIAENEPRVLIDTSCLTEFNGALQSIQKLQFLSKFLDRAGNIIITPEVLGEFEVNPKNSKKGSDNLKNYVNRGKASEVTKERYHRVTSKTQFLKRVTRKLRKKQIDFTPSSTYQSLFNTLCYLADILKIKEPTKRTDESVIAAAFFLTYCSQQKTAVLSNDSHFPSLSCALIRELSIPAIDNQIREVVNVSRKTGIRIYREKEGESFDYELKWDSRQYKPGRPRLNSKHRKDLKQLLAA